MALEAVNPSVEEREGEHERVESVIEPTVELGGFERRLGEVEGRVVEFAKRLEGLERTVSGFEELIAAIRCVGAWKCSTCIHNVDGVCYAWRVRDKTILPGRVVEKDGALRIAVRGFEVFCGVCPLYKPRR